MNTIENTFERGASAAFPDHALLKATSLFVNTISINPKKIISSLGRGVV